MPPEMIATAKYKKKPAGTKIKCSSSSARALSKLGMANYITTESPAVINREMSAGKPVNTFEPVVDDEKQDALIPSVDAAAESGESSEGSELTEPPAPESVEPPVVVETSVSTPLADGGSVTVETVVEKPVEETTEKPAPVVGSVSASTQDATVQHGNKSSKGNPKPAKPSKK